LSSFIFRYLSQDNLVAEQLCCLALNITTINKDRGSFAENVVLAKSQVLYLHLSEGSEKTHKTLSG